MIILSQDLMFLQDRCFTSNCFTVWIWTVCVTYWCVEFISCFLCTNARVYVEIHISFLLPEDRCNVINISLIKNVFPPPASHQLLIGWWFLWLVPADPWTESCTSWHTEGCAAAVLLLLLLLLFFHEQSNIVMMGQLILKKWCRVSSRWGSHMCPSAKMSFNA